MVRELVWFVESDQCGDCTQAAYARLQGRALVDVAEQRGIYQVERITRRRCSRIQTLIAVLVPLSPLFGLGQQFIV
jgi:hypothetical protein